MHKSVNENCSKDLISIDKAKIKRDEHSNVRIASVTKNINIKSESMHKSSINVGISDIFDVKSLKLNREYLGNSKIIDVSSLWTQSFSKILFKYFQISYDICRYFWDAVQFFIFSGTSLHLKQKDSLE